MAFFFQIACHLVYVCECMQAEQHTYLPTCNDIDMEGRNELVAALWVKLKSLYSTDRSKSALKTAYVHFSSCMHDGWMDGSIGRRGGVNAHNKFHRKLQRALCGYE